MLKNKKIIIFTMLIFFVFSVLLGNQLSRYRYINYESKTFKTEDMTRRLISGALGEFSKTLAAYLWLKCDFYWHEYKGNWMQNKEIIPLIKLVTILDPNQIQAYDFGGYQLAMNFGEVHKGLSFLKEGLEFNPRNPDLNFTYALICMRKLKNYPIAVEYAWKAFIFYPEEEKVKKMNALRIMYNSYAEMGDYKDAIKVCELFLRIEPGASYIKEKMADYRSKIK
ncbi:MAG: hypothetical protein ABIH00_00305 [Armatimonadota bacterium]